MLKKLLLTTLLLLTACEPRDATVESKPFEKPSTEGFSSLSGNQSLSFDSASWLFWKDHDDMAEVMTAAATASHLTSLISGLEINKQELNYEKERYLVENLGSDNQAIWEDLDRKLATARTLEIKIKADIDGEYQRPADERDFDRIDQLTQDWEEVQNEQALLQNQMEGIEQQSGVGSEFSQTILSIQEKLTSVASAITELTLKLQAQQTILVSLAEVMPEAPKLIIKEQEAGLNIELLDFQNGGLECSTAAGTIQGVNYKKSEGIIEFLAICKQPEGANSGKVVSYGLSLEKIPNPEALVLSGNMYRCTDTAADGQCLVPVTYGTVEYKR